MHRSTNEFLLLLRLDDPLAEVPSDRPPKSFHEEVEADRGDRTVEATLKFSGRNGAKVRCQRRSRRAEAETKKRETDLAHLVANKSMVRLQFEEAELERRLNVGRGELLANERAAFFRLDWTKRGSACDRVS
jgi:hypothetical protein